MPATWSELDISATAVRGVAGPDFMDENDEFDYGLIRAEIKDAAKRLIRMKVTAKLGPHILQKGGPDLFFNAVADKADSGDELAYVVEEMLVYAFLHQWAFSEHPATFSRLLQNSEYYMERLDEAIRAFCAVAPATILTVAELDVKPTSSVATTSSPDYYNYGN